MSATSATSPVSPVDRRDIRSASVPSKRDKDHGSKWSNGQRPSAGCRLNYNYTSPGPVEVVCGGSESQREKVRPRKQPSQEGTEPKSHGNRAPKLYGGTYELGRASGRMANKFDAHFDAQDDSLSRSLLELIPQHSNNNPTSPIQAALRSADSEIFYSFDNKGPSPSDSGIKMVLEGLVEQAEQKWVAEQTDKIVRGEYEVLDGQGETTVLRKGKRSPKQKAAKAHPTAMKGVEIEDDDGFELV